MPKPKQPQVKIVGREKEDTVAIMAKAIKDISDGVKKLRAGALNEKALVILLVHSTHQPKYVVEAVLKGLETLARDYTR